MLGQELKCPAQELSSDPHKINMYAGHIKVKHTHKNTFYMQIVFDVNNISA